MSGAFKFKDDILTELTRMLAYSTYPGPRALPKPEMFVKKIGEPYIKGLMTNIEQLVNNPGRFFLMKNDGRIDSKMNNVFMYDPSVRPYKIMENCLIGQLTHKPYFLSEHVRTPYTRFH